MLLLIFTEKSVELEKSLKDFDTSICDQSMNAIEVKEILSKEYDLTESSLVKSKDFNHISDYKQKYLELKQS